jgi:hypothetical protein
MVSRGLEDVAIANSANLLQGAVRAVPAAQSPAGPAAFEALLTPQPQAPSGGDGTPAPESGAQVSTTPSARLDLPRADIAPQIEPSGDLSWQPGSAAQDGGESAPPAGQNQRPATGTGKADATTRPEAGRKQAASTVAAASAAEPGPGSATAVRGISIGAPESGEIRPDAEAPRAPELADRTADARLAPEAPKPSTPARNMQFAVGAGDQRVEVRVAERDGELHVAVHTPDQLLAGSLRDELPSLAARLESAGLRTQTWHPGSPDSAGRERLVDASSRTLSQNSQDQPGQDGRRRQDDPPPQRAKRPEDPFHPKRNQKDFQWHLTSLR